MSSLSTPDNPQMDSVYPSGDPLGLSADLRAAYESACYLLETARSIVSLLTRAEPTERQLRSAVRRATELASELRDRIKEFEAAILTVTNEITSANRETVQVASRSYADFPNAHHATLDIAALVCEVVWDGCYRERGFDSERELYSLPVTVKVVRRGLPYIADQLNSLFGRQNWRELRGRLMIEAATVAHARKTQRVPDDSAAVRGLRQACQSFVKLVEHPNDPALPKIRAWETLSIAAVCAGAPAELVQAGAFLVNPLTGWIEAGLGLVGPERATLLGVVSALIAWCNDRLRYHPGALSGLASENADLLPVGPRQLQVFAKPTVNPELSIADYDAILDVIQNMAKVFERNPSVYGEMKEEDLRTVLLAGLNVMYPGNATGETFNGEGRTDILVRVKDNNIFIAECLVWDGREKFKEKITEQLFRYSTWADSKLAAIVFNRKKNFSAVVESMKEVTENRLPNRVGSVNYAAPNSCRHVFQRQDDPKKEFTLTCLAFEVPRRQR